MFICRYKDAHLHSFKHAVLHQKIRLCCFRPGQSWRCPSTTPRSRSVMPALPPAVTDSASSRSSLTGKLLFFKCLSSTFFLDFFKKKFNINIKFSKPTVPGGTYSTIPRYLPYLVIFLLTSYLFLILSTVK